LTTRRQTKTPETVKSLGYSDSGDKMMSGNNKVKRVLYLLGVKNVVTTIEREAVLCRS